MTRVVFMGTGEIAIPTLSWLIEQSQTGERLLDLVGAYTQPDKKVGRKQILTPPAIKVAAKEAGVPVFQPVSFRKNEEALDELRSLDCEIAVVMAYGQILPQTVIDTPKIACVNLHASLLPRHRGASPIQAAIREGDVESGITLMHIVKKLDAGDMILKESLPISPEDTGGTLHDKLAEIGPRLLQRSLPLLAEGNAPRAPQEADQVTLSSKLSREDGRIDWNRPAEEIERLIRAYDPWPGTLTEFQEEKDSQKSKQLKIFPFAKIGPATSSRPGTVLSADNELGVACGEGTSLLLGGDLQLEGRKRLPAKEFLRGVPSIIGQKLGES